VKKIELYLEEALEQCKKAVKPFYCSGIMEKSERARLMPNIA